MKAEEELAKHMKSLLYAKPEKLKLFLQSLVQKNVGTSQVVQTGQTEVTNQMSHLINQPENLTLPITILGNLKDTLRQTDP
jgi:hypothetical protein